MKTEAPDLNAIFRALDTNRTSGEREIWHAVKGELARQGYRQTVVRVDERVIRFQTAGGGAELHPDDRSLTVFRGNSSHRVVEEYSRAHRL